MKFAGIWFLVLIVSGPVNAAGVDCAIGPGSASAANAGSLETLQWAPFRRPERGWAVYAPRIAVETGSDCPATSRGFAAALARWQGEHRRAATGVLDPDTFAVMQLKWTLDRRFVFETRDGNCPEPPAPDRLAPARLAESYGGKTILVRKDALAAYRRMIAAARRSPDEFDPQWFSIFSGFRAPVDDDLRCITDGNCQGVVRAACSAHRTGLAIDMHVGNAPGFRPDSSDDTNRRAMVKTLAYRWLLTNAARFGFVNYVFEPWHWEWSPPQPPASKPA